MKFLLVFTAIPDLLRKFRLSICAQLMKALVFWIIQQGVLTPSSWYRHIRGFVDDVRICASTLVIIV